MGAFHWELVERVVVSGPDGRGRKRHRAFPATAQLRDGTLLTVYREGSDHWSTPDAVIRACRSSDGGHAWSPPETIVAKSGRTFSPHLGMRQLEDGVVLFPFIEGHSITGEPPYFRYYERLFKTACFMTSRDNCHTWSAPQQIDLGPDVIWTGAYGDVIGGDRGEALVSVAWQREGESFYRAGLLRFAADYQSWTGPIQITVGLDDEWSLCRLPSGRILAVFRDWDRPSKQCFSDDGGRTWSEPQPVPFHGQCPSLLQTQAGVLLCAFRQKGPGKPHGVGLAYSYDGGSTWEEADPLYVATDGLWDCAYPNLLETRPGEFLACYYTAALGMMQIDHHRRYADADNAIEAVRFRER